MVKKKRLFGLPRFGSLQGRTIDSFEHWQNFSDWQKFAKFLKLGIALILCYFLKDFLA